MDDLSAEKWNELAAKLEAELAAAQSETNRANSMSVKLSLVAMVLLLLCFGVEFVFYGESFAHFAAMLPLLLLLICGSYVWRFRRIVDQTRNDADRIRRDIRQWKKKKPSDA